MARSVARARQLTSRLGAAALAGTVFVTVLGAPGAALAAEPAASVALDSALAGDGIVDIRLGDQAEYWDAISSMAVAPDGAIYVAGMESHYSRETIPLVGRFTDSGALDTGFGGDGVVQRPVGFHATWRDVVATADNGAVVLGADDNQNSDWLLAKYTAAGELDPTFSGDGRHQGPTRPEETPSGRVLLQQSDGKILVVGADCWLNPFEGCPNVLVQRLTADGQPDPTYGDQGTASFSTAYGTTEVQAALGPDDRLMISAFGIRDAGAVYSQVLARLTTSGVLDGTFDGDGLKYIQTDLSMTLLAVDSASRPLISLHSYDTDLQLERLSADGVVDTTFGTRGPLSTASWGMRSPRSLAILSDGSYSLVGASDENLTRYAHLLSDGAADTGFDQDGEAAVPLAQRHNTTATVDRYGRVLFAGTHFDSDQSFLARTIGTMQPPAAVTGVSAVPQFGALQVSWQQPAAAVQSYEVAVEPGGLVRTVAGSAVGGRIAGLMNGMEHTVQVRAINPAGASAWSAPVTGTPNGCPQTRFSDVGPDGFCPQIAWMVDRGISTGTTMSDGEVQYRPVAPVARQAMAAFLYRAAGEPPFDTPTTSFFADVATTHPFFKEIEWMAAEGISTGTPQAEGKPLYKPTDAVSRQAMAAFLNRAYATS